MDLLTIKKQIESITDLSNIYLIEALSKTTGFFANNGKLLYVTKDLYSYPHEDIETDYLKLQTHIRINAVKNNQTFKDDYYNIIIYKGSINDDPNLESFVQICTFHAGNPNDLNFKEFFYSLISLFQLPAEQTFKNVIGLYGELKFMEYAYQHMQIDISNSWHKSGSYSQYDFSNGEKSIEIKTTLSENSKVTIKHQQIFGDHPCNLVVIFCEPFENGETVEELISLMYAHPSAFNNINFAINLAKELKRISEKDTKDLRFEIMDILFFETNDINPFPSLPDNVSKLSYQLDISELSPLEEAEYESLIKQF